MLQTWGLNPKGQNEAYQERAFDQLTARPVARQACNSCRVKKVSNEYTLMLRVRPLFSSSSHVDGFDYSYGALARRQDAPAVDTFLKTATILKVLREDRDELARTRS